MDFESCEIVVVYYDRAFLRINDYILVNIVPKRVKHEPTSVLQVYLRPFALSVLVNMTIVDLPSLI